MSKLEWETIDNNPIGSTTRLKVFGGWLINIFVVSINNGISEMNTVFISDPNHEWSLEE